MNAGDFTDVAGAFAVVGTVLGGTLGVLASSNTPREMADNVARGAAMGGWFGAMAGTLIYVVSSG